MQPFFNLRALHGQSRQKGFAGESASETYVMKTVWTMQLTAIRDRNTADRVVVNSVEADMAEAGILDFTTQADYILLQVAPHNNCGVAVRVTAKNGSGPVEQIYFGGDYMTNMTDIHIPLLPLANRPRATIISLYCSSNIVNGNIGASLYQATAAEVAKTTATDKSAITGTDSNLISSIQGVAVGTVPIGTVNQVNEASFIKSWTIFKNP